MSRWFATGAARRITIIQRPWYFCCVRWGFRDVRRGSRRRAAGHGKLACVAANISWSKAEFTTLSSVEKEPLTGTQNLKGNEEPTIPNLEGSLSTTYQRQLIRDLGLVRSP